jgi:hypothetical protein
MNKLGALKAAPLKRFSNREPVRKKRLLWKPQETSKNSKDKLEVNQSIKINSLKEWLRIKYRTTWGQPLVQHWGPSIVKEGANNMPAVSSRFF